MYQNSFSRTEVLLGKESMNKLKESTIAVFGIGGVGSYVVEGLVRCGIYKLVLVDYDVVDVTNLNRQIHATLKTIGKNKVDVMKERILNINSKANIKIFKKCLDKNNSNELISKDYDYVVDSIDMVSSKLELIERCKSLNIPIISCMGTGNKLNPTMFEVGDIFETNVCPLAKVMRKELRKRKIKSLKVVWSNEKPLKKNIIDEDTNKVIPSSISFVPSVAGLIIASEVVKDILKGGI